MGILILIIIIAITFFLGKHAIIEGMNLEKNKLTKNLEEYEQKERQKQS